MILFYDEKGENMKFTISEIAGFFSNTKGAIRFYEEHGLIHPKRDQAGNRVYDYRDFLQLFYLKRYQKAGFTMSETADYFTSENEHEISDIEALVAIKQRDIQTQIEFMIKCSQWLKQFHHSLEKIQQKDFSIEERIMDDFYYLDEEYISEMNQQEKDVLSQWIACIPFVTLHVDLIPEDGHFKKSLGIGVFSENARLCNLPIPQKAKIMKGAKVLTRIVEKTGKDFEVDFYDDVMQIYEEYALPIYLYPSCSLIYSHKVNDVEKKYYRIFVPVKENE